MNWDTHIPEPDALRFEASRVFLSAGFGWAQAVAARSCFH